MRSTVTNRAPVITSRPGSIATQGEDYAYPLAAFDPDGDSFGFALTAESQAFGFTLDVATKTVHWTPTITQVGSYRLDVLATDSPVGSVGRQSFLVEVRRPNTAPTLSSTPVTTLSDALEFKAKVSATDAEGDSVRFSLGANSQLGMRIDSATGLVQRIQREIRVAHHPPCGSKFNPIEHRFFPHVTEACRGLLFPSLEVVRAAMAYACIRFGLKTTVDILDGEYPLKEKAPDG